MTERDIKAIRDGNYRRALALLVEADKAEVQGRHGDAVRLRDRASWLQEVAGNQAGAVTPHVVVQQKRGSEIGSQFGNWVRFTESQGEIKLISLQCPICYNWLEPGKEETGITFNTAEPFVVHKSCVDDYNEQIKAAREIREEFGL